MDEDELLKAVTLAYERSEERLDKTNEMIQMLAKTCSTNMEIYDKHLLSLEESRNIAEQNAKRSMEICQSLSETITNQRDDYHSHLGALRDELHRLRDEYIGEMKIMRDEYKSLTESYTRLAERFNGSKSEVKINNR